MCASVSSKLYTSGKYYAMMNDVNIESKEFCKVHSCCLYISCVNFFQIEPFLPQARRGAPASYLICMLISRILVGGENS